MPDPVFDDANNSERLSRAIGLCRVAGKSLVGEVGIVLKRSDGLNDVNATASI
jgi:hypothetical protein